MIEKAGRKSAGGGRDVGQRKRAQLMKQTVESLEATETSSKKKKEKGFGKLKGEVHSSPSVLVVVEASKSRLKSSSSSPALAITSLDSLEGSR